jgi:uncharacterized protein (TIGR02118 family)
MTIRLIVEYDQPEDVEAFFKHYKEVHTPLVKQTPGLQRLVLNRIVGDAFGRPAPYAAIAEMDYPDRETFDIAMKEFGEPGRRQRPDELCEGQGEGACRRERRSMRPAGVRHQTQRGKLNRN